MQSGSEQDHTTIAAAPLIADHELLRVIGRGAYGEVWLARHTKLGTARAVKIIRRDHFGDARPFQREFDGIRRYEPISRGHPNLVAILHVGGKDDYFYYVMELADSVPSSEFRVPGLPGGQQFGTRNSELETYVPHTLRSELKQRGALPIDRCLEIGHALACALAHLHAHKLVHRDVKPSNVIFVGGVAKLADIGLVAGVDDARSLVGTEGYVPFDGAGRPSADCYALGKLLYELSTGHDRTAWPEPPADLATRPDRERLLELNAILHRACAPDLRQRYVNGQEMRGEIELLQTGQSVKQKRTTERRLHIAKRLCARIVLPASVTVAALFLHHAQRDGELHSVNPEAEVLVAEGNQILMSGTLDQVSKALNYFTKAAEKDPNFAPAYIGIWQARMAENTSGFANPPADAVPKLRATATKLIEIAAKFAEARIASSWLKYMDVSLSDALAEARKATTMQVASKSGVGMVHFMYGWYLMNALNPEAGVRELLIAERACPSHPGLEAQLGQAYAQLHDFPGALEHYKNSIDMQPLQTIAYLLRGNLYEEEGKIGEAIQDFRQCDLMTGGNEAASKAFRDDLQNAFRQGGPAGYWHRRLKKALEAPPQNSLDIATYLAHLGKDKEAYDRLNKLSQRELQQYLWCDICFDRKDPRFQELIRKADMMRYKQH